MDKADFKRIGHAARVARYTERKPKENKCSPPMKKLVDENVFIKRFAALLPKFVNNFDVNLEKAGRIC